MNKFKDKLKDVKDTIPFILNLATENFKKSFQEQGPEIFDDLNGALGIAVRLFGGSLITKYFEQASETKLSNFGIQVYLEAACKQAEESLVEIDNIELNINSKKEIIERFDIAFEQTKQNILGSDLIISFSPKQHPIVVVVRQICEKVIKECMVENDEVLVSSFTKNFNENISSRVEKIFGDDYQIHQEQVDLEWYKSTEGKLLNTMIDLNRIGFTEDENLKYQETFGQWKKVEGYRNSQEIIQEEEIDSLEKDLVSIDTLYNEYFKGGIEPIEKILFILADFGKGKSVYLKHKSSSLAKSYEQRGEGPIPVYFNLREFDEYDQGSSFGVLGDYLGKKFGIEVREDKFQENEYWFFIDSLDECGNLTEEKIDKVINSIKKIQLANQKKCRKNRIVITSRPIEYGLIKHLNTNHPYVINNDEKRPVNYYISVYGFKKDQFNDSIKDSLRKINLTSSNSYRGLSKKIIDSILNDNPIDIYTELTKTNLLSHSELTRPIFAYILYKLIFNGTDLSSTNKVGIYLSFINLLTKEAKYINSLEKVNLKDEYRFRNILHSTAALWMYESYKSKQGVLKKKDISNTIEGSKIDEKDENKLSKYEEIENIKFLSQSYFGQKGDTFYFQHQSFAEILLAEYYMKVFLKFALDPSSIIEEARVKLFLGNPTEQTMDFLVGLLILLKESVSSQPNEEIIQKRNLLFPMLASLCTSEFSKQLYSPHLEIKWFETCEITDNAIEPPKALLENWCITEEVLDKIVVLSESIIMSKTKYILTKPQGSYSSLFDNEVIQFNQNLSDIPPNIDKWLSLLVGNSLYNNVNQKKFFISKFNDFKVLHEMFHNWSYFSKTATPSWGRGFFKGIKIAPDNHNSDKDISYFIFYRSHANILENMDLRGVDFSFSNLCDVSFNNCNLTNCSFENSQINDSTFMDCRISWVNFENSSINNVRFQNSILHSSSFISININQVSFELCQLSQGVLFPKELNSYFNQYNGFLSDYGGKSYLSTEHERSSPEFWADLLEKTLVPFIKIALKGKRLTSTRLNKWFIFEDKEAAKAFIKMVNESLVN